MHCVRIEDCSRVCNELRHEQNLDPSHLRAYPANEALGNAAEIAVNFKGRSSELHSTIVWTMREQLAHRWQNQAEAFQELSPGLNTVWYQRLLKCYDFSPQG
jgi:hypothetical protein